MTLTADLSKRSRFVRRESGSSSRLTRGTPVAATTAGRVKTVASVKLSGAAARRHLARRLADETSRAGKDTLRDHLGRQLTEANGFNSIIVSGRTTTGTAGSLFPCHERPTDSPMTGPWTLRGAKPLPAYCDAAVLQIGDASAGLVGERLKFLLEEQTRRRYKTSRPSIMAHVYVLNFAFVCKFDDTCLR